MKRRPRLRLDGLFCLAFLALGLPAAATGQAPVAAPASTDRASSSLARYVPKDDLVAYLEFAGIDAYPDAVGRTAAAKMLRETGLGALLRDIAVQVAEQALARQFGARSPLSGEEIVGLLGHLGRRGFVVGASGKAGGPPSSGVLVIGDGATNPALRKAIGLVPPLNPPMAKEVEKPGGRKVIDAGFASWWFEKDDFVLASASREPGREPVLDTLSGKAPSAADHPARAALGRGEGGFQPIGVLFLDMAALPPLPPEAAQMGLDAIKRVDARWGVRGDALVTEIGVVAPRPRRGLLAALDQPPISPDALPPVAAGVTDYTVLSVDPLKAFDQALEAAKSADPETRAKTLAFVEAFRGETGLRLREDVLGRLGPRTSFYSLPGRSSSMLGYLDFWLHFPRFALVVEVRDREAFARTLDRLAEAANARLKTLGSPFALPEGVPPRPGTGAAEFRRLKGPETGYVLAVPPGVVPTPAGVRLTTMLGRSFVVIATSPEVARQALAAEGRPAARPEAASAPANLVLFSQSDPREILPEVLANIPAIVQFVGAVAASQPDAARAGAAPRAGGDKPAFRLQLDPDAIPDSEALRPYLFPAHFAVSADDRGFRITSRVAFPGVVPNLNLGVGTSTPVLVALLLPAVQSAREAARRSQCTNNMKQLALAMHNYQDANGHWAPAAIRDKDGKPLLSWRVAMLPYLDQQPLYDRFHLDEPWDSPHNRELLKEMPALFACPSRSGGEPYTTTYRVFVGKDTMFPPEGHTRIADATDGLSNTIMFVESKDAVEWTKPEELAFDPASPLPQFGAGSPHPGGYVVGFGDGSVRFVKTSIDPATLRALITRNGGEIVSPSSY